MAKRWHPDIAPPGRQHEHQRHLQAINEAADQLERWPRPRGRPRQPQRGQGLGRRGAQGARGGGPARLRGGAARPRPCRGPRQHDPFGSRVPDHSVVHRYARCVSYPEWGVGTVTGIYFSGEGDDVQQWARIVFAVGVRTVPAGSLQFVDFSTPDPGADRVQRFMTAAQHALAEGDPELAAQRLIYARDADPSNPHVLRLLTAAFWQSGNLPAAARTVRDWARVETDRPTPERFATRIYEDMGALDLAADAALRAAERAPNDASAGSGSAAAAAADGPPRRDRVTRARPADRAVGRGPARPRARLPPRRRRRRRGLRGRGRDAVDPESIAAWSRYAHALARTDRIAEGSTRAACARDRRRTRGRGAARLAQGSAAARAIRAQRLLRRRRAVDHFVRAPVLADSSSTPSSSPTRHTSSRSSSISTHAPAEAGNTTWSPGFTGICTPT